MTKKMMMAPAFVLIAAVVLGFSGIGMAAPGEEAPVLSPDPGAVSAPLFEKGTLEFKAENYEEALVLFGQAYKENPRDPQIVSYLGFTNQAMGNYPEAIRLYKQALTLAPDAPGVRLALADSLYRSGAYDEALIAAEQSAAETGNNTQSVYLKGLVLLKLKRNSEAAAAFSLAKEKAPSLARRADYYRAVAFVQNRDFKTAEDIFNGLVAEDRNSDEALSGQDYLDALKKTSSPYRFFARIGLQYDDNVLAVPLYQSLVNIQKQGDWKTLLSLRGDYAASLKGRWNIKTSYALNGALYRESSYPGATAGEHIFSPNTLSHTLSVLPSYTTASGVAGLLLSYEHLSVDYEPYMLRYAVAPSYTVGLTEDRFARIFLQYKKEDQKSGFFPEKLGTQLPPEEQRDADNLSAGVEYYHPFFEGNGVLTVKTEAENNNAQGANWDYKGYRISFALLYPFTDSKFKTNVTGEFFRKEYSNIHSVYPLKQVDGGYAGQVSLIYALLEPLDLTAGYAHIRNGSNIGIYNYQKNLYTLSLDYRF